MLKQVQHDESVGDLGGWTIGYNTYYVLFMLKFKYEKIFSGR